MKFRTFACLIVCWIAAVPYLQAQGIQVKPKEYATLLINRLDIMYGSDLHAGIRDYSRKDIFDFAQAPDTLGDQLPWRTQKDIQYLKDDNDEWLDDAQRNWSSRPVLKYFYRTKAHFFETKHPDFQITVDPIINFQLGKINEGGKHFVNQRGLAIRGQIDKKFFFYSDIIETQLRVPNYVKRRTLKEKTLLGVGLYKSYESNIFNIKNNGFDYLDATAYFGMNISPHIGVQLGHGKNFIGHGYRSLLLSDVSSNYFYLKLNWKVWKLHYQNIFAELSAISPRTDPAVELLPKKYAAIHYLSFKPNRHLEFGFFESVVFNRGKHFELQYLNPVILYRTVEHFLGSPDNEIAGLTAKWDFLNQFRLYAQASFDEFLLKELFVERRGWWGNKYGIQLGAKWVNAAKIPNLDLGWEYNRVTPYTYSHKDSLRAYTHNFQPLAHPLGANFEEWIFDITYRPAPKWKFQSRAFVITGGENEPGKNWGSSPLLSNKSKVMEFGNRIGQGQAYKRSILTISAGYGIMHNGWVEVNYFLRKNKFVNLPGETTGIFSVGFRLNTDPVKFEY